MATADLSIVIGRPVEDVFAAVTDAEKVPEWSSLTFKSKRRRRSPVRRLHGPLRRQVPRSTRRERAGGDGVGARPSDQVGCKRGPFPFTD